jgi:hypothetical protein
MGLLLVRAVGLVFIALMFYFLLAGCIPKHLCLRSLLILSTDIPPPSTITTPR